MHEFADAGTWKFSHPVRYITNNGLIFLIPRLEQDTECGPPLISIGLNTDTTLDWIKLRDEALPKLHVLVQTVHSS
jgi:hypothetical protein